MLAARDLIPLVSFLLLGGRCRSCGKGISWQYPLVELLGAIVFVLALRMHASILPALTLALALSSLLAIAVTDARTQRIPDAFTIAFVSSAALHAFLTPEWSVWGIVLGGGFFVVQWIASRGAWIGSGDIGMGIGIGILLGSWEMTLVALAIAYILGAIVALFLMAIGRKTRKDAIAFAPFLALGTVGAVMFGNGIWAAVTSGIAL
jgi:prepilin signal peptidase PulO-like enzyme (type II secretory pathway)